MTLSALACFSDGLVMGCAHVRQCHYATYKEFPYLFSAISCNITLQYVLLFDIIESRNEGHTTHTTPLRFGKKEGIIMIINVMHILAYVGKEEGSTKMLRLPTDEETIRIFYDGYTMEGLAEEFINEGVYGDIPEEALKYINYEKVADDLYDDYSETFYGVLATA